MMDPRLRGDDGCVEPHATCAVAGHLFLIFVIPAQAGIQTGESLGSSASGVMMDTRLRGNAGV